jgi:hypothetical protein
MAHPDTRSVSLTCPPVASMWVVTLHSLFLYSDPPPPCHPSSDWLRLFSSQTFSLINTTTFLKPSHTSYLPAYEDGTDIVFRNVGIYNSDARELPRRKLTTLINPARNRERCRAVLKKVHWTVTNLLTRRRANFLTSRRANFFHAVIWTVRQSSREIIILYVIQLPLRFLLNVCYFL